jgi:hypothetical protein
MSLNKLSGSNVVGTDLSLLPELSVCCLFYGLSRQNMVTNSIQIYFGGYYKSFLCLLETQLSEALNMKLYSIKYSGGSKLLKVYILHTKIRYNIKNNVFFFSIIFRIKTSFTQVLFLCIGGLQNT